MSELALRQDSAPAVYQEDPTGGRLVAWAQAASAANQLAKALVSTTFCPAQFMGKPGDATAAIIAGDELGMPPLSALRSIYVVHGTPAMYARTMRALALAHGHEMWTELASDSKVIVCGRRRGSDKIERREWTIQRAQKAGYTTNKKYASNPQEMLQAKADAEVARLIAADVLAGIPYSVEDLELDQQQTVTVEPKRTVRRTAPKAEKPEPEEPALDPDPADAEPMITEAQMKKLHASLNARGMSRDEALAFATSLIGRDLTSSKELTKAEASQVIDALEDEPAEPESMADAEVQGELMDGAE